MAFCQQLVKSAAIRGAERGMDRNSFASWPARNCAPVCNPAARAFQPEPISLSFAVAAFRRAADGSPRVCVYRYGVSFSQSCTRALPYPARQCVRYRLSRHSSPRTARLTPLFAAAAAGILRVPDRGMWRRYRAPENESHGAGFSPDLSVWSVSVQRLPRLRRAACFADLRR